MSKKIHTRMELLQLAHAQKTEWNYHLTEFALNRGVKKVNELIETTWEMHGAKEKMVQNKNGNNKRIPRESMWA